MVAALGNVHASQAYAALIHSCIERTLAVCNDLNTGHKRSTSWSYKLFDSSLSPIASSSTLQRLLKDRSGGQNQIGLFKSAEENLGLFRQTLSVIATEINSKCNPCQPTQSKADFVVRALQELLTDFNWSTVFISDGSSSDEDEARRRRGESHGGTPSITQKNLVMMFSHFPDNMEKFASFLNMPTSQNAVGDTKLFKAFSLKMKKLKEPFRLQDIRGCWIDMPRVSTSLTSPLNGLPVTSGTDRIPRRPELCAVFAQSKWKYTTMDALAIASDCIPPPMLWFSVIQPDLQVQPNAQKMHCKLRVSVLGRDGALLQPDLCRLEAVSIGSNVIDSALRKESVSAMLKMGSLSSKSERLPLVKCPSLVSPVIRIVVKSLILKQDVTFKCTLRYLLARRFVCRADSKKMNSIALAGNGESKPDPLADDASSGISEHDILQQLHQEPMCFEAGDHAWQVLLIAIARKNSVAEVDLYIDGDCSSAILEPLTPQYAAVLQKDQASIPVSPDSNKQLLIQENGPKLLLAPPLLQPIVMRGEGADLVDSECVPSKLEMRPGKRPASAIPEVDGPLVKRGKAESGSIQKLTSGEQTKHTRREAYSWIQHWRYILHRKTIGTGQVHIENRYMRPGSGKKPLKAISIIKCWLDLMSKPKPATEQQIVPLIPAVSGPAEPEVEERMVEGGLSHLVSAERVGEADKSIERVGEADKSIVRVGVDKSIERVGEADKSILRVGEADKSIERVGEADKSILRVGVDKSIERVGEADKSIERVGEADKSIERVGEADKSIVRVGEEDKSIVRVGEEDKSIVRVGEADKSIERVGEADKSIERVGEADKSIERVGEADKSIVRVGEEDKSIVRVGEEDKSIVRVGEADKSIERVGEADKSIVRVEESGRSIVRVGDADKSIVRVGETDTSIVPSRGKCFFTAILDTKEQAESYLSSIEQMLQECLQSDAGDLQVFVKGIMSNAARAQRILMKRKPTLDFIHPSGENKQCPTKEVSVEVHCKAEKNAEKRETMEPCNSDSSCASNVTKGEKVDHSNEVELAMNQETLDSVSGVGNSMEHGGSSDGADSGIKTNEAILSEKVAGELMGKLLVKPKKLARQYSNCDSATPDFAHTRQEKLRSYELQILFRMELIERDYGGPLEKVKTKIVKEICKLLDDIQFDLGGGVFSGESLHDYSIRVIHNSYKKRLPRTVGDIFERMEFNGYVDGVSEVPPAPDSTHAPADMAGSHVQEETGGEEIPDNFATMEAATRLVVPVVQPREESGQNNAFPSLKKDQSKRRRKRSAPVDAFKRASEKRKLASRLTHFGGPDSLQRLKKIRIHHQSPKPSKATSAAMGNPQTKEQNTVLETPRFERLTARAESSKLLDEDNEVDSICTRVLPSVFGFGTPAKVSKHMPTTRKRRQALFKEKKPPGRGLPRLSQDVMKAMAEGSNSLYASQPSQEQASPNPEGERELSADILKDARTTFNSTIRTEMIAREAGDHGRLEKNEDGRSAGLESLASAGQVHPSVPDVELETEIIQESDCDSARVTTTKVGVHQQAVHDSNGGTMTNASRQKFKRAFKSKEPVQSEDCSNPCISAPATQVLSQPAAVWGATQEPVQKAELSDTVENSQPADLTSLENRWDDEIIPCTLPTELPMSASGFGNAQHDLVETERIEMPEDTVLNGESLNILQCEERASRSAKASFGNPVEFGETEVVTETQIVEEVHSQKHGIGSPQRARSEDALSLSTSDFLITWEMLCMDLNGTQDFEPEDRVGLSQLVPATDKSASPGSHSLHTAMPCMDLNGTQDVEEDRVGISQTMSATDKSVSPGSRSLHTGMPLRINQTSKVCRVDPPSLPWLNWRAAEDKAPLVKSSGFIGEDLDFSQLVQEIFQDTQMMEQSCDTSCHGLKLDDARDYLDDFSLLLDENWSPQPRLKPEARLSAILEEDAVTVVTVGSPIKFLSPSQSGKCRRPAEGSPGQYFCSPNAGMHSERRPRSNSTSPNPTKIKMLRFA